MEKKKDLSKLSYKELEEKADQVLKALQKEDLPLDEAEKLYKEGMDLYKAMDERLSAMLKERKDDVAEG